MNIWIVALAAFVGGLVVAMLGWFDSKESFNKKKFGASIIRSLIAGVIWAATYSMSDLPREKILLYAFLGGAGFDVLGNKIASQLGNGSFPFNTKSNDQTTTPTPPNDTGSYTPPGASA
jgi:hypothetical protein